MKRIQLRVLTWKLNGLKISIKTRVNVNYTNKIVTEKASHLSRCVHIERRIPPLYLLVLRVFYVILSVAFPRCNMNESYLKYTQSTVKLEALGLYNFVLRGFEGAYNRGGL